MSTAPRLTGMQAARTVPAVAIAAPGPSGRLAARPRGRRARGPLRFVAVGLVLAIAAVVLLVQTGRVRVRAIRLPWMASPAAVPTGSAGSAGSGPARPAPTPTEAKGEPRTPPPRVLAPSAASALFAKHSWYVPPPPPPPAPAAPPPAPTAPPLPYTLVGSYAPQGESPVYFLANKDRVIDARPGDKLDGVYQFESASGDQLVFVYLPLNIRQNLAATQNPAPKGLR